MQRGDNTGILMLCSPGEHQHPKQEEDKVTWPRTCMWCRSHSSSPPPQPSSSSSLIMIIMMLIRAVVTTTTDTSRLLTSSTLACNGQVYFLLLLIIVNCLAIPHHHDPHEKHHQAEPGRSPISSSSCSQGRLNPVGPVLDMLAPIAWPFSNRWALF